MVSDRKWVKVVGVVSSRVRSKREGGSVQFLAELTSACVTGVKLQATKFNVRVVYNGQK